MKFGLVASVFIAAASSQAVTFFDPQTFSDGTLGEWDGGANETNLFGGPDGPTDRFLELQSFGGGGQGSRMAMFNDGLRYTGDYSDVTAIRAMVRVFSTANLSMRIALHSVNGSEWTSSAPVVMRNSDGWMMAQWNVNASSLTRVQGGGTLDDALTGIFRLQFRHQTGNPSTNGSPIAAIAGFDRIEVVPEPATILVFSMGFVALNRRRRSLLGS